MISRPDGCPNTDCEQGHCFECGQHDERARIAKELREGKGPPYATPEIIGSELVTELELAIAGTRDDQIADWLESK